VPVFHCFYDQVKGRTSWGCSRISYQNFFCKID